ncbi:hypothetical protein J2S73_001350 [Amorphus orientalis]|uniref:Uncharacterized protein n=1 Tax=Amorphus orientalis TaxID=649198 RepID=A0AAE3VN04_9HYPH|nr:hypothetical protein [Amorphus orientalis]MDQ0314913.1 hypothetical protein [Amorphus orientalis]
MLQLDDIPTEHHVAPEPLIVDISFEVAGDLVAFTHDLLGVVGCCSPIDAVVVPPVGKLVDRAAVCGQMTGDQVAIFIGAEVLDQIEPRGETGL